MIFYNKKNQHYLETDALDVSFGASRLQVRMKYGPKRIKHLTA